jgi:hypothetical protein
MNRFWVLAQERVRQEEAEAKAAREAAEAKEKEEAKEREKKAPAALAPAPLPPAPAPAPARAPITPADAPVPPQQQEDDKRGRKRKVRVRRRRRRPLSPDSSPSSSDSMDDADIVNVGKHVADIRDMNKAYPLLARRHQTAIRRGVKKIATGDFHEHLTPKEKKSVARKKDRFKRVYKGGKNPFSKKNSKVGKTYARFMKEVSFKEISSSDDSDDSSTTYSSGTE